MRLYAFLLVAAAALCARAATIPVAETEEKKLDVVPDNLDKIPENTSSEQELIDQANTITDVDNQLRTKPEDIPVTVVVEDAPPALSDVDEEIDRPVPDLRNPGPPQRQEHETQNPEFYAYEQQSVALLKQSINDAQNFLKQGFQRVSDSIQSVAASNEPIQTLQLSIQSLRDGFAAQMIKVNETIQSYLSSENVDKPDAENTKTGFQKIEQGLFKLRNDFNAGVGLLATGVDVAAALKADTPDAPAEPAAPAAPAAPPATSPAPPNVIIQGLTDLQSNFINALSNMASAIGWNQGASSTAAPEVPAGAQNDAVQGLGSSTTSPFNIIQNFQNFQSQYLQGGSGLQSIQNIFTPPPPGQFGSGSGPVVQWINSGLTNLFPGLSTATSPKPAVGNPPVQEPPKPAPVSEDPVQPSAATPTATPAATPVGPIRQILQNNPISVGIAGAVQRLQTINNPEKPRDELTEQVKEVDEDNAESEFKKGGGHGHGPNSGDNNDSSSSSDRLEPEVIKQEVEIIPRVEVVPEVAVPEVQKASEDEKTEQVVDKTE